MHIHTRRDSLFSGRGVVLPVIGLITFIAVLIVLSICIRRRNRTRNQPNYPGTPEPLEVRRRRAAARRAAYLRAPYVPTPRRLAHDRDVLEHGLVDTAPAAPEIDEPAPPSGVRRFLSRAWSGGDTMLLPLGRRTVPAAAPNQEGLNELGQAPPPYASKAEGGDVEMSAAMAVASSTPPPPAVLPPAYR